MSVISHVYRMSDRSVFSTQEYMEEVENGYITRNVHPLDNNIVILNYTDKAIYDRRWNDVTLNCRGLILNELTGEILARPFKKFFNYGEVTDSFPTDEEVEITYKHDGSLGISYMLNGEVKWATRGSFTSNQAWLAQEIWDKKYKDIQDSFPQGVTFLVEIIHPNNKIVVDYGDMEDLILLGAYHVEGGWELNYMDLSIINMVTDMPIAERFIGTMEEAMQKVEKFDHNNEGFVAHWRKSGLRLKFKSKEYLDVHRIIHGLSLKNRVKHWHDGTLNDLIRKVPEEFRAELEEIDENLTIIFNMIKENVIHAYNQVPQGYDRKRFALWVKTELQASPKLYHTLMFALLDGKEIDPIIKDYILSDYKSIFGIKEQVYN